VEEIRRSARSVEEAVDAALGELGVSEQEVDVTVLQEPRQGVLGIGAQDAEVLVRLRRPPAESHDVAEGGALAGAEPARQASRPGEATEEDLDEQADVAADFLEGVVSRMGMDADVEPAFEDGTMYVDVLGKGPDDEDMGLLIGRHGQTLEALHELTRIVVAQRTGTRPRVVVDVEDYKRRQRDRLQDRAREVAARVARTGTDEELEPMNAFERKVVHDAVAAVPGASSSSRGEEPERRVVIAPA
jgi:spoIIIJ-associated protein